MPENRPDFAFVEAQLRRKTFGVLSTQSPGGSLQATGILYGVSPPGSKLSLYLVTERSYLKVRNISRNPEVAFLVPYPHYFLRFVPASCISLQGRAEIVSLDDPEGREAFAAGRILRDNLKHADSVDGTVFIRIRPKRRVHCYGIGIGLTEIARDPSAAGYSLEIPPDRLW